MSDRHERSLPGIVESRFLAILDLANHDQDVALAALCADYPELATTLRAWMKEQRQPEAEPVAGGGLDTASPAMIGPYRVLERIAHGGMGVVYAAEQQHPVRRRVAVKVIKPGMDSNEVLARFEAERQALALMNHPHIAQVLEAGTTAEGRPYFAMEFVAGLPITSFADKNRLTMRERLELFAQLCDGVQHAHQKGVVHRDLKPSNILVTYHDGKPFAKIIDFGVAKATQQPLTDKTVYTHQGELIGTPEYMSPEQAEMTGVTVDTRSDIYSMGVILYEVLTGTLPFDRKRFRDAGLQGMLRILREQEPDKPSTKVTTIGPAAGELAYLRRIELGSFKRALRGDLDWITVRALEKDPGRRYQSASEFGGDIVRHLRDEPVLAGPPTFYYRLSKIVRRHKGPIAAAAAVLLALVAGLVVSLWLYVQLGDAFEEAKKSAKAAEEATGQARIAQAAAEAKQREIAELLAQNQQMRDDKLIDELTEQVDRLWPARPHRIQDMSAWIERAGAATSEREQRLSDARPSGDNAEYLTTERTAIEVQKQMIARVRSRLELARSVLRETIEEPAAQWVLTQETAVQSSKYAGLAVEPRLGLIPLGVDPRSGLLEFAHYGSGVPVQRHRDGSLGFNERSGLVFVLLPSTQGVWIGTQSKDPAAPNYDVDAQVNESAPELVSVAAFFVSKFEITQAQWRMLTEGQNPSRCLGEANPVEFVDCATGVRVLAWHDMELPTEIQWEYACRAGTNTPWWTGLTKESLLGNPVAANIADRTLLERGGPRDVYEIWAEYDDNMAVHGRVGLLRPNAFGLPDVLGNVFEWCLPTAGTDTPDGHGVARGGAWNRSASDARVGRRLTVPETGSTFDNLGLRPVMRLTDATSPR